MRYLKADEVTFRVEITPSEIPVKECFATGDDDADLALETKIIAEADGGNVWAWFDARVIVEWQGVEADDELAAICCWEERHWETDFLPEMRENALLALNERLSVLHNAIQDRENNRV